MRLLSLLVFLGMTPLLAAPVPKALKKTGDETRIVGEWEEPGGKQVWIFHADGTAEAGDPANPKCTAVYKIDPTLKHLDWSQDGGKLWYRGAYELDGETLKFCLGGNNGDRPPNAERGNGHMFVGATRRVQAR
jgi:hypothetical protein